MQKISSYLYSNRISVAVDDFKPYRTEWKIVYQRRIKIYQGVDNILEFEFKNAQQRRVDISGYSIKCVVTDSAHRELCTVDVIPIMGQTGLGTATIPVVSITGVAPQFLNYSLFIEVNDSTYSKLPVYADTQFGVKGQLELIEGIFPIAPAPTVVKTFTYLLNDLDPTSILRTYYSEAASLSMRNSLVGASSINVDFEFAGLEGLVKVETTTNAVISTATPWTTIDSFNVAVTDVLLTKRYIGITNYSLDSTWLRIVYEPVAYNTGVIDKFIVRN